MRERKPKDPTLKAQRAARDRLDLEAHEVDAIPLEWLYVPRMQRARASAGVDFHLEGG